MIRESLRGASWRLYDDYWEHVITIVRWCLIGVQITKSIKNTVVNINGNNNIDQSLFCHLVCSFASTRDKKEEDLQLQDCATVHVQETQKYRFNRIETRWTSNVNNLIDEILYLSSGVFPCSLVCSCASTRQKVRDIQLQNSATIA